MRLLLTTIYFFFATAFPTIGLGATLIVTHPERQFDFSLAAGPATLQLLQNSRFDRKIILTTGSPLTFSTKGLNFELWNSKDGEIDWDGKDNELYIAGGYYEFCQMRTIIDLIKQSDPSAKLNIHLSMKATYLPLFDTQSTTFENMNEGDQYMIEAGMESLGWQIFHSEDLQAAPGSNQISKSLTLNLMIDGKVIKSYGNGSRIISLIFERNL